MRKPVKPSIRFISEYKPTEFTKKQLRIFDIFKATEDFFEDNFRGAICVDSELACDGFVLISPDGFAYFHKVLLNAVFGESVVRLRMFRENGLFKLEASWKIYNRISKSDLDILSSTATLSGFSMKLNESGEVGALILEAPVRQAPEISISAVSQARMRETFTRVFFF